MEFRILGPVDAVDDGSPVALGAQKQRALFAVLLLARGEAVSVDRLVDALWGERPPASAAKSIQVYVSHLRKALGDVLETRGRSYLLRVEPDQLDAARFERLLERGREHLARGEAREAADALRDALALWRGPALADFAYEPFAQAEVARLEELRMAALEERIDADLALGRHGSLVGEIEALIRHHPLRERLRGQLMLALYGCGRQGDALEAYREARHVLIEELGIEPSPSLREIHAAVLRQDPELVTASRHVTRMRARRRGGVLLAAGGATLAIAAMVAVAAGLSGDDAGLLGRVRPLPPSFCSPLQYAGGAKPRMLIVSDQGLQGPDASIGNQVATAVEHVLRDNDFRAGRHAVAYQACDDSTAEQSGDPERCATNAGAYAGNPSLIGIIGPTLSVCARQQIATINRASGGPIAMISPSNTHVGLTRAGFGAEDGEPGRYYPTGVRNYVRLMPTEDLEGAANAVLARRMGIERVFLLANEAPGGGVSAAFDRAAEKLQLTVTGAAAWDGGADDHRELARAVERSGATAVFLAGGLQGSGGRLVRDLRAAMPGVRLLASSGFSVGIEHVGPAAEGMTVSITGLAPSALDADGKRFLAGLESALGEQPSQFAVYAAQATQLLLDAVARSDGTRASVLRELFSSRVEGGILGDFAVTDTGDTTATHVTIYRVARGRLRLERVITPPVSLIVAG